MFLCFLFFLSLNCDVSKVKGKHYETSFKQKKIFWIFFSSSIKIVFCLKQSKTIIEDIWFRNLITVLFKWYLTKGFATKSRRKWKGWVIYKDHKYFLSQNAKGVWGLCVAAVLAKVNTGQLDRPTGMQEIATDWIPRDCLGFSQKSLLLLCNLKEDWSS